MGRGFYLARLFPSRQLPFCVARTNDTNDSFFSSRVCGRGPSSTNDCETSSLSLVTVPHLDHSIRTKTGEVNDRPAN